MKMRMSYREETQKERRDRMIKEMAEAKKIGDQRKAEMRRWDEINKEAK